jgi:hypothetical protein
MASGTTIRRGFLMGSVSKAAAALAAAALLIAGGSAYALATSSGGTITVCVKHKGGTLYKAKRCAKADKQLSWNNQGPPGLRGATGAGGMQGPGGDRGPSGGRGPSGDSGQPGARGPSDAYYATGTGGTGTGAQTVALSVPAGDYAASAIAMASTPSAYSVPSLGSCTLSASGDGVHFYESKGYIPAQFGTEPGEVMLPAQSVFHLPEGGTIGYYCQGTTTSYAFLPETWSKMQITAIQVGTEHG